MIRLFFFLCMAFGLCLNLFAQDTISILDAVANRQIDIKLEGSGNGYYGESMILKAKNLSKDELMIKVESGLKLLCREQDRQDMIVTKTKHFRIKPKEIIATPLFAMCGEIHDRSPNKRVFYTLGHMALPDVQKIAKTIEKAEQQNKIGQHALWAVTDQASKELLTEYGSNAEMLKKSISLLNQAKVAVNLNTQNKDLAVNKEKEAPKTVRTVKKPTQEAKQEPILAQQNPRDTVIIYRPAPETKTQVLASNEEDYVKIPKNVAYAGGISLALALGGLAFMAFRKPKNENLS